MTGEEDEKAQIVVIEMLAADLTNGLKEQFSPTEATLIVLLMAAGVCALSLAPAESADEAWKSFTHQHSERTFRDAFNRYRNTMVRVKKVKK